MCVYTPWYIHISYLTMHRNYIYIYKVYLCMYWYYLYRYRYLDICIDTTINLDLHHLFLPFLSSGNPSHIVHSSLSLRTCTCSLLAYLSFSYLCSLGSFCTSHSPFCSLYIPICSPYLHSTLHSHSTTAATTFIMSLKTRASSKKTWNGSCCTEITLQQLLACNIRAG